MLLLARRPIRYCGRPTCLHDTQSTCQSTHWYSATRARCKGFPGFCNQGRIGDFGGRQGHSPTIGINSAVVSSPLMLAQHRPLNSRWQFHNALATEQHRHEAVKP